MDRRRSRPGTRLWLVALDGAAADRLVGPDGALDRRGPGAWLDGDERSATLAKRRAEDRRRYAASHVALRQILARELAIDPGAVVLARAGCPLCDGPHGRPVVAGRPEVELSLSRTGAFAVIAVASVPVGVDAEVLPPEVGAEDLAAALHGDEAAALRHLVPVDRDLAALRTWTRKEALLKGWGTGLGVDPAVVPVGLGCGGVPPSSSVPVALGPIVVTATPTATATAGVTGSARTLRQVGWDLTDIATGAPLVVALARRPNGSVSEVRADVQVELEVDVVETTLDALLTDR